MVSFDVIFREATVTAHIETYLEDILQDYRTQLFEFHTDISIAVSLALSKVGRSQMLLTSYNGKASSDRWFHCLQATHSDICLFLIMYASKDLESLGFCRQSKISEMRRGREVCPAQKPPVLIYIFSAGNSNIKVGGIIRSEPRRSRSECWLRHLTA